jgi:hypothetical protein
MQDFRDWAKILGLEPEPAPFLRQFPTAPAMTAEFPADGWRRTLQDLIDYEDTYWEARRQVEVSKAAMSAVYDIPDAPSRYRFRHLSAAVSRWVGALDISVEEAAGITSVPAERLQAVIDGDYGKADASDAEMAYLALLEHAREEPSKKTGWGLRNFDPEGGLGNPGGER